MKLLVNLLVIAAVAAASAAGWTYWMDSESSENFSLRVPGQDISPDNKTPEAPPVDLEGLFVGGEGKVGADIGDWPSFRGPDRTGISTRQTPLADTWPTEGPKVLWTVPMGEGYAGAAVRSGRVYVLDYDQKNKGDALRCFSLDDGREIWRRWYKIRITRNHGISRTVPAVEDGCVVTLGPKCHVMCVDAVTGDFRWGIDLVRRYETKVPLWYAGQCPLIDKGRVILAPAGREVLMTAIDLKKGKTIWETPNTAGWEMSHSSIAVMEFAGKRMYVYCASNGRVGGIFGVDADDGKILWEARPWKLRIPVATPLPLADGKIFWAGGYGAGSVMLQLTQDNGEIKAETLFALKPAQFGAVQQTPIFHEGRIYGVRPDQQLACLDLSGRVIWTSGAEHTFGLGPFMIAGDRILAMNDEGLLTMARFGGGFDMLARAKVLHAGESWGPMTLVGGKLIIRDLKRMICLDVAQPERP